MVHARPGNARRAARPALRGAHERRAAVDGAIAGNAGVVCGGDPHRAKRRRVSPHPVGREFHHPARRAMRGVAGGFSEDKAAMVAAAVRGVCGASAGQSPAGTPARRADCSVFALAASRGFPGGSRGDVEDGRSAFYPALSLHWRSARSHSLEAHTGRCKFAVSDQKRPHHVGAFTVPRRESAHGLRLRAVRRAA